LLSCNARQWCYFKLWQKPFHNSQGDFHTQQDSTSLSPGSSTRLVTKAINNLEKSTSNDINAHVIRSTTRKHIHNNSFATKILWLTIMKGEIVFLKNMRCRFSACFISPSWEWESKLTFELQHWERNIEELKFNNMEIYIQKENKSSIATFWRSGIGYYRCTYWIIGVPYNHKKTPTKYKKRCTNCIHARKKLILTATLKLSLHLHKRIKSWKRGKNIQIQKTNYQ